MGECFAYSPMDGRRLPSHLSGLVDGRLYRNANPTTRWEFNPWTGVARAPEDVKSDPTGLLMVAPGAEMKAAR